MKILETNLLNLHQGSTEDAEFILTLLNDPSCIQNIGDRGVRRLDNVRDFIQGKKVACYMELGFGLYMVKLKDEKPQNLSSIRVLEKIGLKFEKMIKLSTDDIDLGLYSIDLS